jgi:TorA maturation chaperone TorD
MNPLEPWLGERWGVAGVLCGLFGGRLAEGLEELRTMVGQPQFVEIYQGEAARRLAAAIAGLGPAPDIESLAEDYAHLFGGPDSLAAPPWESVYRTEERLLFGEPEQQVRSLLAAFGMAVENEPADHIAFELAFLARLSEAAIMQPDATGTLLAAQKRFVDEHLLQWVPAWSADVEQHAALDFWKALAAFCLEWLRKDLSEIDELLQQVE